MYCLESADNPVSPLDRITLPLDMAWSVEYRPELLGGVMVLRGEARVDDISWSGGLYEPARPIRRQPIEITAVPYCVWDNRAPGEMRVWFRS